MEPFFSILIPIYNQVGKMDRCIHSLKNQTFTDFEVILVDDGSTDASYEMLLSFAEDPRFRVLRHEKNSSVMAARYTGMQAAGGSYCLFLDSDDYVEINMLEVLHRSLAHSPADILRFGFFNESDGAVFKPVKTDDPFSAFLDGKEFPAIWKRAYSREVVRKLVEKVTPFYCNMGEDSFYSCVFYSLAGSVGEIDDALYHYVDGGGMSGLNKAIPEEKLKRDLDSAEASTVNTLSFLEQYNPAFYEKARIFLRSISRYILWMAINAETDLARVVDRLRWIKEYYGEDLYFFGCRKLLECRVRILISGDSYTIKPEDFFAMLMEEAM